MKIHFHADKNWINDPNGLIYYNGQYHIFYQYFPYGKMWGTMHWGHAISKDLIDFEQLPMALFPTRLEDANGCFSGTAAEKDGQLILAYTGVRYLSPNPANIHKCLNDDFVSSQLLITSADGQHFDNFNGKEVILPVSTDPEQADPVHTRDPKIWPAGDEWRMVLGTRTHNQGRLLFYKSTDLKNWELLNTFTDPKMGSMAECPDIFTADGQQVLIFSPMDVEPMPGFEANQAYGTLIDFDEKTGAMSMDKPLEPIDYGWELYAPQTMSDEAGRRVMLAWLRMPDVAKEEWIGLYGLPRLVKVHNGAIYYPVHPNVQAYFNQPTALQDLQVNEPFRLQTRLQKGQQLQIGGLKIGFDGQAVYADRRQLLNERDLNPAAYAPIEGDEVQLEIYGDEYIFEVFINDGQRVLSQFIDGFIPASDLSQLADYQLSQHEKKQD